MKTASLTPKTEVEVWLRILHPDDNLSPRVARAILGLSFRKDDLVRMRELSAKARAGTLTPEEDTEMNDFERVGSMLSTLKSKARQVLSRSSRSACAFMKDSLSQFVWDRAQQCCEYCRMPQIYDDLPFEVDHIITEQHEGKTIASNLALACFADNHHKGLDMRSPLRFLICVATALSAFYAPLPAFRADDAKGRGNQGQDSQSPATGPAGAAGPAGQPVGKPLVPPEELPPTISEDSMMVQTIMNGPHVTTITWNAKGEMIGQEGSRWGMAGSTQNTASGKCREQAVTTTLDFDSFHQKVRQHQESVRQQILQTHQEIMQSHQDFFRKHQRPFLSPAPINNMPVSIPRPARISPAAPCKTHR